MATRSGSVAPGLLLWLLERKQVTPAEMASALEHQAGLRGLGGTPDMRGILARRDVDQDARLALDVYLHRLRSGIAAMAAALEGIDALAFTGRVGERAPAVRAGAAEGLGHPGDGDCEITAPATPVRAFVITSREDLEVARQTRSVLTNGDK